MSVQLLTEHHLVFLSLKGGCVGSSESRQNATLLEISCRSSIILYLSTTVSSVAVLSKVVIELLVHCLELLPLRQAGCGPSFAM